MASAPEEAHAVVAFWREAGPKKWFTKDSAFDVAFRDRFALLYSKASRGELSHWRATPEGALAEILLLDQYPRNAFRDTPWAFATDELARQATNVLVASGADRDIPEDLRPFAYMPWMHSESLEDQNRCVEAMTALNENNAHHAREHRKLIERFGRFPHRNAILGRTSTAAEQEFLASGGYSP
jgi:uncharacterized protein (DUF924 family)